MNDVALGVDDATGRDVVMAATRGCGVRVYDAATRALVRVIGRNRGVGDAALAYGVFGGGGVTGVAVHDGRVYAVDGDNHRVQVFSLATGVFERAFGTRGSGDGQFSYPWGVAVDDARVYVSDSVNDRVCVFDTATGKWVGAFGVRGSGDGQLSYPRGLALDGDELFVADAFNHRVSVWRVDGGDCGGERNVVVGTWVRHIGAGVAGSDNGQLNWPCGVAVCGARVHVADTENHRVCEFDRATGAFVRACGGVQRGAGDGEFDTPWGIAARADGRRVYVADTDNHRVQVWGWQFSAQ